MAQRLADEQIIELISTFVEEEENRTIATYEDFKVLLYDADYGYVVEGIATKCPVSPKATAVDCWGICLTIFLGFWRGPENQRLRASTCNFGGSRTCFAGFLPA
jgi:hypothetical protein